MQTPSDFSDISGPAWDNSSEYPSIASTEFQADERVALEGVAEIASRLGDLAPVFDAAKKGKLDPAGENQLISELQELSIRYDEITRSLYNLHSFLYLELSMDSKNRVASTKQSELNAVHSKLQQAMKPWMLFLQQAPDRLVELYLDHPHTRSERFKVLHDRALNDTLLSESEEKLITALSTDGHHAWGQLYDSISGALKCRLRSPDDPQDSGKEMGLAQTAGLLRSADEAERKSAWHAIQAAWKTQEEPCSAILNSLAGWRIELARKRSHTRPIDFLSLPLHRSHIERETLEAMFSAVRERIESPRRALKLVVKGMGKDRLDPWDLMAPPPEKYGTKIRSFEDGFAMIVKAFDGVSPEMGDFARMMLEKKWIEGRVLPGKRQGAYCSGFPKSRTPRVYQTYMGTLADIKTLAHELGHAYHSWVLRDLPLAETRYPMTLAETASIFAETAFADEVLKSADEATRFEMTWKVAEGAGSSLLNIPARFSFEKEFYELRGTRVVPAEELSALTEKAWHEWYGESLSRPDPMYWASKLHFAMAGRSFYNYPYTFGYLFSLGIYAQRERLGDDFITAYKNILRDTGRMTAEALVQKHLDEDIRKPDFWSKSIAIVERKIDEFEVLLNDRLKA